MVINKLNYERYALDYLDGTLSGEMMTLMEDFLKQHPAISDELNQIQHITLLPDKQVKFPEKAKLKKIFSLV